MFRVLLCIAALLVFECTHPAWAKLPDSSAEHARSAFRFAEKKDWNNALPHARNSSSPVFEKLILWQYLLDQDSGASFDEITHFIEANPEWPEQKKLHIRAEMALRNVNVPDNDILAWFNDVAPITGVGKIALAEAMRRNKTASKDKVNALIHDAWRGGDFDEPQETKILDNYGDMLTRDDHIARIDRLLWEDRVIPAKRILSRVPAGYQKLFKARIALIEDKRLSIIAVAQVPAALKKDPGLTFDRMRFRARRDDDKGVREMLLIAPDKPPYPEKWWKYRELQAREAIDEKNFSTAKKLLANHGQVEGSSLADAIWLQGWLKTEYLQQPKDGYISFATMYDKVKYPVSRARAAYWAARAAEKSGDENTAAQWYAKAVSYPTTFYGQLSTVKSSGATPLRIPAAPAISAEARQGYDRNGFIQAIKLCIELGNLDLARRLITLEVENTEDEALIAYVAELGEKGGHSHLSVRAAKKALQQNIVLIDAGYPTPDTPATSLERPLTLAITRQESEFDPNARSPSNALGMMQLLPRTAKEVAMKNALSFSSARLSDPNYNMTLGSLYLSRLIRSYDGSYIMGIAAYNAGPGNVRKWVAQFGTPNNDVDNAVNWIEKIPFYETRNYVQRVLENLQVYRSLETDNGRSKLALNEDLIR